MIFDGFSPVEGSPLYRQIIRHIQRGLAAGTIRYGDELRVYYGRQCSQFPLVEIDQIREHHPGDDYILRYGRLRFELENGEIIMTVTLKGDIAEIRTRILEAKHFFEQADGDDAYGAPEQEYEEYDESDEYAEDAESEEYSENNENKE